MIKSGEFALEKRLKELDENFHQRFSNVVYSMQFVLNRYKMIFPTFTDHSLVHSINVVDFCNQIIGDQLDKLNVDEIYILLLASYLHDTGMGISMNEYEDFSKKIDFKDFFLTHDKNDIPLIIRSFHHEYSALFIEKYAHFLELPSPEYMHAVAQVSKGHRKVDLDNIEEYPIAYPLPNGNTVCLPYLSALVRLADEIDVTAARNCAIDFKISSLTDEIDLIEFNKHEAVKDLVVTEKEFIMKVHTDDEKTLNYLEKARIKMQSTLDSCRNTVNGRTKFIITQEKVVIERI